MSSLEDTERGSRCVFASSYPARPPGCLQGHRKGCEREAPNRGVAGRVVTRRKRRPAPQGGGRWEGSPARPRGISRRPVGFPGAALSPAGPSSPPPCPGRASGAVGEGVPGAPRTGSSCLSCLPRSARLSGDIAGGRHNHTCTGWRPTRDLLTPPEVWVSGIWGPTSAGDTPPVSLHQWQCGHGMPLFQQRRAGPSRPMHIPGRAVHGTVPGGLTGVRLPQSPCAGPCF